MSTPGTSLRNGAFPKAKDRSFRSSARPTPAAVRQRKAERGTRKSRKRKRGKRRSGKRKAEKREAESVPQGGRKKEPEKKKVKKEGVKKEHETGRALAGVATLGILTHVFWAFFYPAGTDCVPHHGP